MLCSSPAHTVGCAFDECDEAFLQNIHLAMMLQNQYNCMHCGQGMLAGPRHGTRQETDNVLAPWGHHPHCPSTYYILITAPRQSRQSTSQAQNEIGEIFHCGTHACRHELHLKAFRHTRAHTHTHTMGQNTPCTHGYIHTESYMYCTLFAAFKNNAAMNLS